MELNKNFDHQSAEAHWYQHWIASNYFSSKPDSRDAYTIVIPPPNVTGVLHMGHCLNNTIQDILIRRARMQGKNACWVPGTDHASIATETKVVQMLREKGITKSSLTREEFLSHAWEWKEKYGGIILQQLKKLGCSLDWDRTSFTMDDDYYNAVIKIFIELYNKGLIYRGKRMVNWDPTGKTALSDEEVIFKEVESKLYYVNYPFTDGSGNITVATTRPETILGDVAICVNPTDERYASFIGKEVTVPLINRKIKIIADEYVTADFGTGALKVTPAHDKNDYMLGEKYQLSAIDTLDDAGMFTLHDLMADEPSQQIKDYAGMDRFALRKKIAADIEAIGLLQKVETYKNQVGTSERTGAVIENKLSLQWFVNMQAFMQQNPQVLSTVMNDEISFHPAKLKNTYRHWLENIKDWCISRQLWWGQRIPAWYDDQGNFVVAATKEEAKNIFTEKYGTANASLKQDEDVLDTWFSSWLWPMEVFKGISHPNNDEANYYYPSTTLVTGQDIIFFWVARMIMAGYEFKQKPPFKDVYFTGMVRDKQGRKMSKQLGNSPDLLAMIEKDGADAVRFGILISSPAGNDLMWDEAGNEQGRFFINKMWNALKLIKGWQEREVNLTNVDENEFAIHWFDSRLQEVKIEIETLFKEFRLSEALKVLYSLIWDDFCSWYLEWVKPGMDAPITKETLNKSVYYFEQLMQLLHPFMPFITEDIYQKLAAREQGLPVTKLVEITTLNKTILSNGNLLKQVISSIREWRVKNQLKPKEQIVIHIDSDEQVVFDSVKDIIQKQVNASSVNFCKEPVSQAAALVIGKDKIYIVADIAVDSALQKEELEKNLAYQKGFLISVEKKLSNEKFVQNAKPEIIALEQKKKADAEEKIKLIEESLATL